MSDVRDDIAFIRQAVADGRSFAFGRSPDILVWGIALAAGFFANYAALKYGAPSRIGWIWLGTLVLPWAFTMRRAFRVTRSTRPVLVEAVSSVWIGSGIFLTTLTIVAGLENAFPRRLDERGGGRRVRLLLFCKRRAPQNGLDALCGCRMVDR